MSPALFLVAFVAGAASLALWLDVRFPGLAPKSLRNRFLVAVLAFGVLSLPSPAATAVTVVAVYLPLIAFAFLAMLWLLKVLAERLTF